jgi:carbonic anhydrase
MVDARGVSPDSRHQAIVEQNVLLQTENLRTYDVVHRGLLAENLTLHSWVFDLSTGRVLFRDADAECFIDEDELEG